MHCNILYMYCTCTVCIQTILVVFPDFGGPIKAIRIGTGKDGTVWCK